MDADGGGVSTRPCSPFLGVLAGLTASLSMSLNLNLGHVGVGHQHSSPLLIGHVTTAQALVVAS